VLQKAFPLSSLYIMLMHHLTFPSIPPQFIMQSGHRCTQLMYSINPIIHSHFCSEKRDCVYLGSDFFWDAFCWVLFYIVFVWGHSLNLNFYLILVLDHILHWLSLNINYLCYDWPTIIQFNSTHQVAEYTLICKMNSILDKLRINYLIFEQRPWFSLNSE